MNNKKVIIGVAVAALVLAGAAYLFMRSSTPANVEDVNKLTARIGALMLLPNEVPTVATVSDPSLLKNQPFFTNAVVGDRVVVYPGAKKAILFRESENKIIEVAPLSEEPAKR